MPARPAGRFDLDRFLAAVDDRPATSYLLVGPETYLRERALEGLVERGLGQGLIEYNLTRFDGPEVDLEAVVNAALTYPAFSQRRVVVVCDLDLASAAEHKGFMKLMAEQPETTILIVSSASLTRQGARTTRKAGTVAKLFQVRADCEILDPAAARRWLQRFARERKSRLSAEAADLLLELVGTQLTGLEAELEKVFLHAMGSGQIERADVEAVTARTREHTVWELSDALAAGQRGRALKELDVLLEDGAEPIALIGILAFKLRQLLEGSLLIREGVGGRDLNRRLKLWGAGADAFAVTCRRTRPDQLVRSLKALRQADDAIKSTRVDPRILLERAVLSAVETHPPGQSGAARR